jgi:hypothetical protein
MIESSQITDVNDPPRLSDALIAAGNRLFALENLLHESHPAPSRLLSDPVGTIAAFDEDAGQTVTVTLLPSPRNLSKQSLFSTHALAIEAFSSCRSIRSKDV